MVDAPWLSPGENSGAFFIFGHLSIVSCQLLFINSQQSTVNRQHSPLAPHSPIAPLLLGGETTSGKGRLAK
jgi:hypothetical protein